LIMDKLRICRLLGIRYPILQGGMLWIADASLASAVSNAGALGTISPYAGMAEDGNPLENFRSQISRTRQLTDLPFAANIPLDLPDSGLLVNLAIGEKVGIIVTAAGSPEIYTELLHSAGIQVIHVISSVSQARFAQNCGVDFLIAEGIEAGGRVGRDEIPLFSLVPQVVSAVSIPVIAAGGIVDTHGMMAAIDLGAEGVQLGTRFIAVKECIAHPNYKQAILEAGDADTIVAGRILEPARRLRSKFSLEFSALEQSGMQIDELRSFVGRGRTRKAQIDGNLCDGDFLAGASAGLIHNIVATVQVIEGLIGGSGIKINGYKDAIHQR
jgi:enoyl-[acyl-carrier protein] reductase II